MISYSRYVQAKNSDSAVENGKIASGWQDGYRRQPFDSPVDVASVAKSTAVTR